MIVYVAGPYSGGNVDENIENALRIAAELWEKGHTALCPHGNTYHFEKWIRLPNDVYIERDLHLLGKCDAVVMIPGWEKSPGASIEKGFAEDAGIPVFIYPELPELEECRD